jgi:hypothetical protein
MHFHTRKLVPVEARMSNGKGQRICWVDLTDEQHCKVHSTFLRFRPSVGALKSTDEHLTVSVTAHLAKRNLAGEKL